MNRTILTVAGVLSASSLLLVDSAIKGTVLLVLAAVVTLLLRRDSAATRHLVWLLAIVAMLVVPVLSAMLPQWRVLPAWASHSPRPAVVDVSPPAIAAPESGVIESPRMTEPVEVERPIAIVDQRVAALPDSPPLLVTPDAVPAPAVRSWNWLHALPLVWVIGFAVLLLRLSSARWMLWNSERRGTVIGRRAAGHVSQRASFDEAMVSTLKTCSTAHDPIVTAMESICLQLGISRPVTLLIHPDKTIPVVWGIIRCRLMLPAAARQWSVEQLRSVLLHELAHIKRRDATAQLLTQIACALHWFNPLVWFAAWRLDVERERACDDLVLASGVRPSAYAGHLLEVVTGLSPARWTQSCGLAMARKSSLEGRLVAVLGKNLNRRGVSVALAGIALAIAAGIAVPIAMLGAADEKPAVSVQRQESQPEAQAKDESPKAKVVSKLPGRIFVDAGLRTSQDDKRFSQSAIAIDPNTGSWTRLQDLSKGGFTVPLSPVRVSPDGKSMLFMREKEIWKCDALTGENPVRVFQKGQPQAWAPDSKEFLVVVEKEAGGPDKTENWRVSADGKQQSVLSLPLGDVVEDWSPDGRWLLGWSHADGQLHLMKPDGSDRRKLTNSNRNASRNEHPRFSQDSRHIVYLQTLYQGTDDAPDSRFSLRTINIDGTDDREILGETAVAPAPAKAIWTAPMGARWSPDGKHLAVVLFDHTRDGGILAINGNWRLAIIDADGGNLRELKLEGVLTAVLLGDGPEWRPLPPAVATQEPKQGAQLKPATEQKLKWGEPVSGLRMALAWPPTLGEPGMGDAEEFFLVVQNVSETAVRLAAGDAAPNPRRLMMRENGRPLQAISDPVPTPGDWLLQPREVAFLRLYQSNANWKDGRTVSSAIEQDIRTVPRYSMTADMTIAKAPPGAWTGKLVTGQTRGSADVADAPAPMHKDARTLYEIWQRHARGNGDIPGGLVGELAGGVRRFIRYNPTWKTVPTLNALLPRLDGTRDWKPADAIALLDEIAAIQDSPLSMVLSDENDRIIVKGQRLPKELAEALGVWNPYDMDGLRVAWELKPRRDLQVEWAKHVGVSSTAALGEALKARLFVHNSGKKPIVVRVPTFLQCGVKAGDVEGKAVECVGIEWTTLSRLYTCRLAPGESVEINTPGIGFGKDAGREPWAGPRVGWNVLTQPGGSVRLEHAPVPLDGSESGRREDAPFADGPNWWPACIKARLARELPLPADATERARLLDRAANDLFGSPPTEDEREAFAKVTDDNSLAAFAAQLAQRPGLVSFFGKLRPVATWFKITAANAKADKQPRVVLGPGEYPLPSASAERGDATLKIVGRPVGDRRTNDAQLLFEPVEFTGALPPDPHKLEVPDGWGTWAIVCRPSDGYFYLLHKGGVRKIDYSRPRKVTDTPANDLPAEFRDEVKRILDIHEISEEQQAEIFKTAAAPAASLRSDVQEKPKSGAKDESQKPKDGAKLNRAMLEGVWMGEKDGVKVEVRFQWLGEHQQVQWRLQTRNAGITAQMSVVIEPDGTEAKFVFRKGLEFEATLGRVTVGEGGSLRLQLIPNPHPDSTECPAVKDIVLTQQPNDEKPVNAKLPADRYANSGRLLAEQTWPMPPWGAEKDGLSAGIRVIGDARIGGKVKAELWVRNSSAKDVTFSQNGRADVGLNVVAKDKDGKEHHADITSFRGKPGFSHLPLPSGHGVKVKEFSVKFGADKNDKLERGWVNLQLTPGDYKLRAVWSDTTSMVAPEGEWTGKLTTGELAVMVVAPDAPASNPAIRGKVLKPDGSPAAGVEVRVDDGWKRWKFRGPGIPDLPWPVKTAADGTFSIEVAKGSVATNYEAFASSDDFAPLNAKVPEGGDVGVMQFAKGSRVTGRVIGLDGAGLAKIGIWCKRLEWQGRGPAPMKLTSTGADGSFSIPPIATGRHLLQILTRDLGAKELTVAFANHVIEAKDDAPVAVEICPLPTVNLTGDST